MIRGLCQFFSGKYQRAVDDFSQAILLNPKNAMAYANRAMAYEKLGKKKLAQKDLERAKSLGYKET